MLVRQKVWNKEYLHGLTQYAVLSVILHRSSQEVIDKSYKGIQTGSKPCLNICCDTATCNYITT